MFTKENAASMGAIGGVVSGSVRNEQIKKRLEDRALADLADTFEGKTLMRVRLQLDRIYEAFMTETLLVHPDASKLDRLASAQARLSEQERILSGRPMPGSLKPNGKAQRRASHVEPDAE